MKTTLATLAVLGLCLLGSPCFAADVGAPANPSPLRLAQSHADICKANLDNCTQGCAGASGCTNQCQTNYEGCMSQGG